ncbi:MAG: prepilin peptidase [Planctomycetaceae bacterium]|nr:prepilin peptidase [Planctomycetaceae bacterium]
MAIPHEALFWFIVVWLFILGSVIGSFLNVCVYRIPQKERLFDQLRGLVSPGSHCPKCNTPIRKTDNIPIFGWLRLKGRCRNCQSRISFRYPLIEFLNGLLFVVVYWLEVPREFQTLPWESCTWTPLGPHLVEGWSDITMLHLRYVYHMILLEALLVASLIDLDTMTIPDGSTLPAMILGIVGAFALGQMYLVPVWFQDSSFVKGFAPEALHAPFGEMESLLNQQRIPHQRDVSLYGSGFEVPYWVKTSPHLHGLAVSLAGLLVGGGIVWGVRIIGYWTLRREAMGFGDVILMALVGVFLGWQATLVAFFVAPFFAMLVTVLRGITHLIFRGKGQGGYMPYGLYLSLGAMAVLLSWKWIWPIVGKWFSTGPFVPLMGIILLVLMVPALLFVQLLKRILGIPLYNTELEDFDEWPSADQLTYLAGEFVERDRQQWTTTNTWTGEAAAQGMIHEERWRSRDTATGWPE